MQSAPGYKSWFEQAGKQDLKLMKPHPALAFLKDCYNALLPAEPGVERMLPFAFAQNDWSMLVKYAEGYLSAHQEGVVSVLKGTGVCYSNADRYPPNGPISRPFDPDKAGELEVAIRFTSMNVWLEIDGLRISNPMYGPRFGIHVVESPEPAATAAVLFGLEDVPDGVADKKHYPCTLWSVSLKRTALELTIPK